MAGNPPAYVLDSFALLAYLEGEAGMPRVRSVLAGAEARRHRVYLSLINLGEALYITERASRFPTPTPSPSSPLRITVASW